METFRRMVNDCIRIGLQNNASTLRRLCQLSYKETGRYNMVNYYRLCAISKAAGILANRKKSIKRGYLTKDPYMRKPILISCYGFKVKDGILKVPLGNRQYFDIPLNNHTKTVLASDPAIRIRSFTLTLTQVSICYSKELEQYDPVTTIGIDRNLANITAGNSQGIVIYNVEKAVEIAENSRSTMRAFRRNDVRIRRQFSQKYGQRRKNRINQLLHKVSEDIVQKAKEQKVAIVFEDIQRIRQLYRRGNYQRKDYRFKMNSWPYHELKSQIEYKAAWEGVPVITLSKSETRGTSQLCPRCGKKITQVDRKTRQLWCAECKRWMDRDIVAAMNLSIKGLALFASSKGLAGEAMKGNLERDPVILRVDASKLSRLKT